VTAAPLSDAAVERHRKALQAAVQGADGKVLLRANDALCAILMDREALLAAGREARALLSDCLLVLGPLAERGCVVPKMPCRSLGIRRVGQACQECDAASIAPKLRAFLSPAPAEAGAGGEGVGSEAT
jgi:hypothetical protein